ncbi:MAG: hypothetical protein E7340_01625 [Clostridiales bacterium]|nr:hypothetical protein [Clostridiales bacterium]
MRKILSLFLALVMSASVFTLIACNGSTTGGGEEQKCVKCVNFGTEISYKIDGLSMKIGNACLKCGFIEQPIDEIELTDVATADESNVVTKIQDQNPDGDIVIGLKKGVYDKIFVGSSNRSVHVVGETGAQVIIAQCNGSANGATFENLYFYTDPESGDTTSKVKFETAGGEAYWSDIVIKNCVFEGRANIDSAWKKGIVDNMTIIGTTFKNITGWKSTGSACAIFTGENWGKTTIKDCVFDHIDYAAMRLGTESTEGEFLIENCFFRDVKKNACIMFSAHNETLQCDNNVEIVDISLEIKNCVFADSNPLYFSQGLAKKKTSNLSGQNLINANKFNERLAEYNAKLNVEFIVGPNTWVSIPTSISNATHYDIREQNVYEGEI